MFKKLIFGLALAFVGVFGVQYDAHAWTCTDYTTDRGAFGCNCADGNPVYCSDTWYGNFDFCDCNDCPSGYTRQCSEFSPPYDWPYGTTECKCVPACSTSKSCSSSFSGYSGTYNECTQNQYSQCSKSCTKTCSGQATCPSHATCTWDTSYKTYGEQYYGSSSCNASGPCPVSTITCNAGYYKSGSACDRCPLADDVYTDKNLNTQARYTSSTGATSLYDCYPPSGTTYYDAKGTFTFNATCNYK